LGRPTPDTPRGLRISSAVSVPLYVGFALVLLNRAGVFPGRNTGFVVVAAWVLFANFTLGILGNVASRSRHEETMAPTSAVLAAAALIVAAA